MSPTVQVHDHESILPKRKASAFYDDDLLDDPSLSGSKKNISTAYPDALVRSLRDRRWNRARKILERKDAVAFVRCKSVHNIGHRDPLRCACYHYAPLDIVKSIYYHLDLNYHRHQKDQTELHHSHKNQQHPLDTNNKCWTALHEACCYSSEEVVSFLLDVTPWATAVPDQEGRPPLYHAVEFRRSPSIIRNLLLVHPTAIYAEDRFGTTPLHRFFCRWEGSLKRRNNNRKSSSNYYPAIGGGDQIPGATTILPHGIDIEATLMIRTFLLLLSAHTNKKVDETILFNANNLSWVPLVEALRYDHVPPDMLLFLLKMLPDELKEGSDKNGNFAVHVAASIAPSPPLK